VRAILVVVAGAVKSRKDAPANDATWESGRPANAQRRDL
jgi:hypothetical protein